MDTNTRKSLEFQYILNQIQTLTPYGLMYKNRLAPYVIGEEEKLKEELNKIKSLLPLIEDQNIRREFNNIFAHIKDLRTSIKRAVDGFILTEVELFEIKSFLFFIRDIVKIIEKYNVPIFSDTEIKPIKELEKALDPEETGISTFYIYDSYSEDLRETRKKKRQLDNEIRKKKKQLKIQIKEDLNLDLRPDSSVIVQKDNKDLIKQISEYQDLIYVSESYINIKFSIKPTLEMETMEKQVTMLKDKEEQEEILIRETLSKQVGKRQKQIFRNMAHIGRLDLLIGKIKYAIDINGVKPNILQDQGLEIQEGIHPKVAEFLGEKNLEFTPISIKLKTGVTCITGANMGGKTISLKLVGLLSAMAQYGLFVPAKTMSIGLNNFIKSSIGDMQSTDSGLSTFGGEIKIVQEALVKSDNRGLILIDELARGTNPEEGYAISKAIVSYLKEKESITLLTTHYDNVANIEEVTHLQVIGLSAINLLDLAEEFDLDKKMEIVNKYMNYQLRQVKKETQVPKDAINIAKLMGLEDEVLRRAEEYLDSE